MKEIKKLKTKAEEIIKWEAIDGTIFSDKEECEKYEESALCILKARLKKITVNVGDAWDLMGGYDDHSVWAIKMNTREDVQTVEQFMLLTHSWWSELFKEDFIDKVEKAFLNNDLILLGINGEAEFYYINTRQGIINNLLNLDKDESSCSSN